MTGPPDPRRGRDATIRLDPGVAAALGPGDPFDRILALDGPTFRSHKNRRTFRAEIGGRGCFVKIHGPTGWGEILKNVLRGRKPTLTAEPEVRAIERLTALGVPTVRTVGHGRRGRAPAWLTSFILTEELAGFVHLDAAIAAWGDLPPARRGRLLRRAIDEAAAITRAMHGAGLNHRDLYLCHFMLPDRDWTAAAPPERLGLHVIDLHRVQIRARVPWRWVAKDLSGLLFSSLDVLPGRLGLLRFLRGYLGSDWKRWWRRAPLRRRIVLMRALAVYRSEHGRAPRDAAGIASRG